MIASARESNSGTLIEWREVPGALFYGVVRASVKSLRETEDFISLGAVSCIEANSLDTQPAGNEDGEIPAPGEAFFYLVAYDDGWSSSYGTVHAAKPRVVDSGDCR